MCYYPFRGSENSNCAQQVLQYAADRRGIPWSPEVYKANAAFHSGLGIGSICCGLLGAFSVLGMLYDEDTARQKCLILMDQFQAIYGTLLCPRLQKMTDDECTSIIQTINRLLEPLILEPSETFRHTL